jgi:hypothetical protein
MKEMLSFSLPRIVGVKMHTLSNDFWANSLLAPGLPSGFIFDILILFEAAAIITILAGRFLILGAQFFVDALCRGAKPQRGRRIVLNIDHIIIITPPSRPLFDGAPPGWLVSSGGTGNISDCLRFSICCL